MDPLYLLAAVALGLVGGLLIGTRLGRAKGDNSAARRAAEEEADKIRRAAESEIEQIKKGAEVEGKELARKHKSELDDELRNRRTELAKREEGLAAKEREVEKQRREAERRAADVEKKEKTVDGKVKQADSAVEKAEAAQVEARKKLEQIASLTEEQARKKLEDEVRSQAYASAAVEIKRIEDDAHKEATSRAKTIVATAIQRFASEFVHERTVAVVPLPSDDLKGRLIGREGRNIRALEAATGVDMIIDDTAESITISCFNPVRRETARLAISALVADGRIHPTRIEEVVRKAEKDVDKVCKEAGEQAVFDLGLHRVHPELVKLLGRLKFRQSYAQNVLLHSIEVGYLAGLIAAELGANVKLARRAGLLHDIGKAVDHEHEGPHAEVGAALVRKHGESPKVAQAIASHHGDDGGGPQPQAILDHVVASANALSAARPGARREQLASYIKRLDDLEAICKRFGGVERAYALMAGREIRVMVMNDQVDDAQAVVMSKEIARAIENEATYPGQVRVVVVRETRASDYAR
ncbi:MAG: ribonuclease Y [Deltaproteobacteria bacterium]|nr:ribonuclease Y [Deltaproteobacteria bacterium]MDQ3299240.1 ribonuclease Y [Myxococcota bacterium]